MTEFDAIREALRLHDAKTHELVESIRARDRERIRAAIRSFGYTPGDDLVEVLVRQDRETVLDDLEEAILASDQDAMRTAVRTLCGLEFQD